jgi:hypothetical protein
VAGHGRPPGGAGSGAESDDLAAGDGELLPLHGSWKGLLSLGGSQASVGAPIAHGADAECARDDDAGCGDERLPGDTGAVPQCGGGLVGGVLDPDVQSEVMR